MCVEDKRAKKRSRNFLPGLLGIGLRLMQEGDEMVDSAEVLYIYIMNWNEFCCAVVLGKVAL